MFNKRKSKLFLPFILLGIVVIFFLITNLPTENKKSETNFSEYDNVINPENEIVGPGLPASKFMPQWYLPTLHKKIHEENNSSKYFTLYGKRITDDCLEYFTGISQYCGYANYRYTDSSEQYEIGVWYFSSEHDFVESEKVLSDYLLKNGDISIIDLNITKEVDQIGRVQTFEPENFSSTKYESKITSGYFVVYERPFTTTRDDYFIVYYGIKNIENIAKYEQAMKELIANTYYTNSGYVRSLKI